MYFSDITNEELQPFHGLNIPNISISLTDILDSDLFRIENITSNIYRIYPLFYTDKITSSNPNDQILENKCIICQEQTTETYFTFISNEEEPIEDYIKYGTYFDIGDSLSVSEFNEIVFLLRENHTHNDEILLKQGSVQGQYGEYVFDIESTTIVDKGILITNETLTNLGTVTLTNPLFSNSDYTLKLKVSYMTDVNVCDDVSEDNIVVDTLSIPLVDGVTETIPFDTLDYNYIIGFDAVVEITHTKPIINGVWVDDVDLSVDETTVDVGDTITLTATVTDNHGDSVSGVTVTFKNGATTLGTASTNSSGVATYNYTTTAGGVLSLTATANSLVSDVVEVTVEGVVPASMSLVSDKDTLSYADGQSATLTATVLGSDSNPYEGATVVFKAYKGGTLVETIGSDTTDSNGVASVSYSSKGSGDLNIKASVGSIVSETYSIEDLWLYSSDCRKFTGSYSTGSDSSYSYITGIQSGTSLNITFPSEFEITYKLYKSHGGGTGLLWYLGGSTSTCLLIGTAGGSNTDTYTNIALYNRVNGNNTVIGTQSCIPKNTWTDISIKYKNGVATVTANGQSVTYNYTMPSSIIMQSFDNNSSQKITQLKIKPL